MIKGTANFPKYFDTAFSTSTFRGTKELRCLENEDIVTLVTYHEESQYITNEEKQWPLFRKIVLQWKHGEKDISRNISRLLKENRDDVERMALSLAVMTTVSESMAASKRGFSFVNPQKQTFVHDLQKKH